MSDLEKLPSIADYADFNNPHSWWPSIKHFLKCAGLAIHHHNKKWWVDLYTGEPVQRNAGELLMLIVSEVAEGMEGHRKNLMDDKLTHRPMLEVELADAVIRILDMGEGLGLDVAGAIVEKCEFNTTRSDHSREVRLSDNGKKY